MSIKRTFTISLDEELAVAMANFMAQHGFETPSSAVRFILRSALASTMLDGAVAAAQKRVFEETKRWVFGEVAKSLDEIKKRMNGG